MSNPKELRYTKEHEWARVDDDGSVVVGITPFAASELGEIVYVEGPEIGQDFTADDEFGTVESVKAVSSLYLPIDGKIVEVNTALEDNPELVNDDPFGEGWIVRVAPAHPSQLDALMDGSAYDAFLQSEQG